MLPAKRTAFVASLCGLNPDIARHKPSWPLRVARETQPGSVLVLAVLTLAVYNPVSQHPFVNTTMPLRHRETRTYARD